MSSKKKYTKYFDDSVKEPNILDKYSSLMQGKQPPDAKLPSILRINKDLGEGLSTPKLMAKYNAYNDAGSNFLSNYGGLKFIVDMGNGKEKDMTNVYLRAYDKAMKNPERYSEKPVYTNDLSTDRKTLDRRLKIPLTISKASLAPIANFTKDYYIGQNARVGVNPTKKSSRVYDRTKLKSYPVSLEARGLIQENSSNAAYTQRNKHGRASTIYLPAWQRAEVLRTGSMSDQLKETLAHEFSHVADNSNFSTGSVTEPLISETFKNLPHYREVPASLFNYDWGRDAGEFRANIPGYYLIHQINPNVGFNGLKLDQQLDMTGDLMKQQGIDPDAMEEILQMLKQHFHKGGKINKTHKL